MSTKFSALWGREARPGNNQPDSEYIYVPKMGNFTQWKYTKKGNKTGIPS